TAEALTDDGFYRTGDLARIDSQGYMRITGRVKDVINRGGEKVPVAEIEQLLYAHPAVREAAIVAMPDERLGERACAFVALEADVRSYVQNEGERWAELIERERRVPLELWDELRERGYLRLAAPVQYGGRGIPFSRYLRLLELFSMSHASLRMIVHVCNGIWRPIDSHASREQRERFVLQVVSGAIKVAFTLTAPTAGTGADLRCCVVREGYTYYLSG